jgi:DNA repair exonuclease SbcCD ATPase subunit
MSGSGDFDQAQKAIEKTIDGWGKKISVVGKQLKDVQDKINELQAKIDQMEALRKQQESLEKQRQSILKGIDGLSDSVRKDIIDIKLPPPPDPKKAATLPKFLTDRIGKEGLKLGDYGSVKPDIDLDLKKMQFKRFELTWTFKFK